MHKTYQVEHDFLKARNLMNTPRDTLDGSTAISKNRIRVLPLVLIGAYASILIATLMDAMHGRNLIATSSLLSVGGAALVLVHCSRFLVPLETIDDWLWQLARCSALAGLAGVFIGLAMMTLGAGTFEAMTRGLSFAAFSVLYGILVAMPASCAVLLGREN